MLLEHKVAFFKKLLPLFNRIFKKINYTSFGLNYKKNKKYQNQVAFYLFLKFSNIFQMKLAPSCM